jgi:hypothetical protein
MGVENSIEPPYNVAMNEKSISAIGIEIKMVVTTNTFAILGSIPATN